MITVEEAFRKAEETLVPQRVAHPHECLATRIYDDSIFGMWVFFAACPTCQQAGLIPGGLFVTISKADGHVWSKEDWAKFEEERERERAGDQ